MHPRIDLNNFSSKENKLPTGLLNDGAKELLPQNEALGSVLNILKKDAIIYWHSNGEWSMHELLVGLLSYTGKADLYISSYAFCEKAARTITQLRNANQVGNIHLLLDSRINERSPNSFQILKSIATVIKLTMTHAKVTVLKNETYCIACIGSANYTENKRHESGIITTFEIGANMQLNWINKALYESNS